MANDPKSDVTSILSAIQRGEQQSTDQLLPLVYSELRRLAAARMFHEMPGQTLQATALVHEAYLKLVGDPDRKWDGRAHFFGAAAEAMRRILIDRARRRSAVRHGGALQRVDLDGIDLAGETSPDTLIELDEALKKFASQHQEKAELVKLRYFAGLTLEEVSDAMGISVATAKRWWIFSRAWLYQEMGKG